jgi:hypothetical protein
MQSWQKDVVADRDALKIKIGRLNKFLDGDVFKQLSAPEQYMLEEQYRFMFRYYDILVKRIETFEVKNGSQALPVSD